MVGRGADGGFQVLVGVAQAGQDGHEADAGQDASPGHLFHGRVALFHAWAEVLHLADALVGGGIGRRDQAEEDDRRRPGVDLFDEVEVAQDEGRALQDGDGKAEL